MGDDIIDYGLKDVMRSLENVKKNLYGIKDTNHIIIRSKDRNIDLNIIHNKINLDEPICIEKTLNESNKFLLTYEYTNLKDLCIGINILNEEEIQLLTVIDKSAKRRKH